MVERRGSGLPDAAGYEYMTVTVFDRLIPPKAVLEVAGAKIADLKRHGWELVDAQSHGIRGQLTLQLRRPK